MRAWKTFTVQAFPWCVDPCCGVPFTPRDLSKAPLVQSTLHFTSQECVLRSELLRPLVDCRPCVQVPPVLVEDAAAQLQGQRDDAPRIAVHLLDQPVEQGELVGQQGLGARAKLVSLHLQGRPAAA